MDIKAISSSGKIINRCVAGAIFLSSLTLYVMTAQSSVAYWDCAEYAATIPALEVPHPPGAPLFEIVGRIAMMMPYVHDPAFRLNLLSCLASALSVMLLYLISARVICRWRGFPKSFKECILVFGSAAIGSLTLAVSDTFWFNAVESCLFASSLFLIALMIWLTLVWFDDESGKGSHRYLLLVAYLLGLSAGVHQLSLLCYFSIVLLVYLRFSQSGWRSLIKFALLSAGGFLVIYPGIVKWFVGGLSGNLEFGPLSLEDSLFVRVLPIGIVIACLYGLKIAERKKRVVASATLSAALLVLLGYSTYTLVFIRANGSPAINEDDPANMERMVSYINRDQYGKQPAIWPRRWSTDALVTRNYSRYSSDWDYFISYQLEHMFLRYVGFNFIGRAGDVQDSPVALGGFSRKLSDGEKGYPANYFGIPFLLGLFGLWYHFRKDWKVASAFLVLFVMLGLALAVYFNMAEPQPRERDYFFVGSFFVFSLWVALGAAGILEYLAAMRLGVMKRTSVIFGATVTLAGLSPGIMFDQNLFTHNRHDNLAPLDASYDILQSCRPNAILFTGGDNDTFPLWYLQEALGIRTDVRVICLSLANTDWYLLQLRNESPHGALKVPIGLSDEQITNLAHQGAMMWRTHSLKLDVPEEVYSEFGIQDTSAGGRSAIQYTLAPTIDIGGVQGLRTQDVIVNNIIQTNAWARPIEFTVTTSPQDFVGLQDYMERAGLVYELTPVRHAGPYYNSVDAAITHKCLFVPVEKLSSTQSYGFVFANFSKPGVYYDSNTRNMISAIRDSFITLAAHYQSVGDYKDCMSTLNRMDEMIPPSTIPEDYRLLDMVTKLYYLSGDTFDFRKCAGRLEEDAIREIDEEADGEYAGYSVLLDVYGMEGKYRESVTILERLRNIFPSDQNIAQRINELEGMINRREESDTIRESN